MLQVPGFKRHIRNLSLPESLKKALPGQLRKNDQTTKSDLCINGPHLYVPGTGDSGTNSSASSPEVKLRSSSMSNICLPEPPSQSPTNRNESNSAKRHSTTDLGKMKTKPVAPVAALYRPKNYYRLDVKELNKVSTIHEEPDSSLHTMSHKELVKLVSKHKIIMSQKDQHIRELEDYIGSLLVKVMMQAPEILDIQSTHVTKL
uniref:FIP-RBD domain-containing protein n=1 Tax=Ciona savignyi TaxID=51511 RepID=H2YBR3_CIOSA